MEQILINENRSAVLDFQSSVESVLTRGQELIETFHAFQNWKQIKTIEDFSELLRDPAGYFDEILLQNVDLRSTGNLRPNVEIVADLYSIDRDNYQNLVAGKSVSGGCKNCQKTTVRKGQRSISFAEVQSYQDYILFNEGILSVNQDAVNAKKESFRIVAETPEQIEMNNFWHNACNTLNSLKDRGYLGIDALITLQKSLKNRLLYSYETGKLHISDEMLLNEILKLK